VAPYPSSSNETTVTHEVGTITGSFGVNGAMCTDDFGQFPCTCLTYFSSMYQSVETWPSHPYTLDDGVVAGQGNPTLGATTRGLCLLANAVTAVRYTGGASAYCSGPSMITTLMYIMFRLQQQSCPILRCLMVLPCKPDALPFNLLRT